MLAEMPASQFDDWLAAYNAEPWGEERADMRMARQVWATLQVASKKKLKESNYRFDFAGTRPRLTPEQYRAKSMRAYAGHGGRIVDPKAA